MVKAVARAFRWRKMLDEGVHGTIDELATAKAVAPSYVSRVLRLTLLAPEILGAILDGRQPAEMGLDDLLERFPLEWEAVYQSSSGSTIRFDSWLNFGIRLQMRSWCITTYVSPPA
jgi:hypothetical protein